MNWKEIYSSKLVDADTALKVVKNGDKVVLSGATGSPKVTADALASRIKELDNVTVVQGLALYAPYLKDDVKDKVRHLSCYLGPYTRDFVNKGNGEFAPIFLKDWGYAYGENMNPDVAIVSVSPPDSHGYCTLGIFNIYATQVLRHAKTIIAEVNVNMPRVHGTEYYHVSEFNYFVETDTPLITIPRPKIGPVEEAIGGYIAPFINDGDCLQLGIGSIPDAVLGFLKNKRGLGIHSEMFADGVMDLVHAGAIDNKRKTLNPGKMVSTFFMGTREFYDFINDNPTVMFTPGEYSNSPTIIGQNDNMVSINSAVEVDLMGQAASESIGATQFSSVGGQVDFIRGARNSRGGRAYLAFPATVTDKSGKLISKIVANLAVGTPVTTSRNDVDCVVTEYGVAQLKYKTNRERALELISIAHPDFRAELKESLKKMNW